ncbi:MAG TPA: MBL fold metallo-hydrolase [Algoriphagus sp.]|jgi:glyoxylase-like metal-dependent hydrolase (beta-lactamase superfamily II)/rhodanese-related sulfurtransferase|uniref:MBL fold metallo-hydrolase n=1 Tax=unclassified Algoriphagus TaxID=2641541 RepID=UPI000C6810FE|nr:MULTISPECIES: rhodanese-like domain-containing protein [unclassified Algoriphagus]MAL13641.1 MBL fold metallo-hydrolase [Algoriphagus sp.]QYH39970.1 MBL fold metallo-hydrolase [Algoriphagus sp. NBT04N3]HAD51569.1 MBL fold metallo-hydrolase [Algoriphagus sp.]HAS58374.1 MBL fold metallo-hydrolase [Algoriphagus sp.]HCB47197.1 MBL fold metallo-hydrolase [Algoriphagus sp.]|tara:strand:+ start:372 stop:1706 length:1335 start_codon:yes stop_codon:yes gene_type:complete
MNIKQFYDEGLAHASYAIESEGLIALVDPGRNPNPYYDFAETCGGKIVAVIETHPHADFVSSHLEFHQNEDATIYVSKLVEADYPHSSFDEGDSFKLGKLSFHALHTPGHSPDSISVILKDENGKDYALFSGDTLFIGDVGRPDLREKAGNMKAQRKELAQMMYKTVQTKLKPLSDDIIVYPAHGAGSLCGKNLSDERQSTIGEQRENNWAFGDLDEKSFVDSLLEGQPYIPKYFSYDVDMNKTGAPAYQRSISRVGIWSEGASISEGSLIIDARKKETFAEGHIPGSINIMNGAKFETWLGSIVAPEEHFFLVSDSIAELEDLINKASKIGYEQLIKAAVINPKGMSARESSFNVDEFKTNPDKFTIVDIRSRDENHNSPIFEKAMNIPLQELRERTVEIPDEKPILVHCAGGYRSAAGSSIVAGQKQNVEVFDFSEEIKNFQ